MRTGGAALSAELAAKQAWLARTQPPWGPPSQLSASPAQREEAGTLRRQAVEAGNQVGLEARSESIGDLSGRS